MRMTVVSECIVIRTFIKLFVTFITLCNVKCGLKKLCHVCVKIVKGSISFVLIKTRFKYNNRVLTRMTVYLPKASV